MHPKLVKQILKSIIFLLMYLILCFIIFKLNNTIHVMLKFELELKILTIYIFSYGILLFLLKY